MVHPNQTQDITDLLFLLEEPTPEDKRKMELWKLANSEAYKLTGIISPILLFRKANELYREYLSKENLPYNEERGL